MENSHRTKSLAECKQQILVQYVVIAALAVSVLVLVLILFGQSKIIIEQMPGMPPDAVIQKSSLDKGSERAVLAAVTSNLVQVNPSNAEYQKAFLQSFLAPDVYTRISAEIDATVKRQTEQRELGSYYNVLKEIQFDPAINRHFVISEVHTVNVGKDTSAEYVFEYQMHVENYRAVIDDVKSYTGDKPHNSAWIESHK